MRLILMVGLVVLGGALMAPACIDAPLLDEAVCDPGENIFCRCRGGEAGTKACKADGKGFESCVSRTGECPDIGGSTTSTATTGGGAGTGGDVVGGGGSGGGAVTGSAALYEPCAQNEECESGFCPMGYCSQQCANFRDCQVPKGDCIRVQDFGICLRTCAVTLECDSVYGARSLCGYADAVDDLPNTVCAYWEPEARLPPEGSACFANQECNLGNAHRQAVCAFETCAAGCYEDRDCPDGMTCSSQATLGSCR